MQGEVVHVPCRCEHHMLYTSEVGDCFSTSPDSQGFNGGQWGVEASCTGF